jgi:hypothetical protein
MRLQAVAKSRLIVQMASIENCGEFIF